MMERRKRGSRAEGRKKEGRREIKKNFHSLNSVFFLNSNAGT
jgi:hypothetical protein